MRAGRIALTQGDVQQAHELFRQAAFLNPRDEEIWLALFHAVDTAADRRACLENVLAINPYNTTAAHQLEALEETPLETLLDQPAALTMTSAAATIWDVVLTFLGMVAMFALGMLVGVVLNLL